MKKSSSAVFIFTVACAVLLLLTQCIALYGYTGRDDAFLTYWPALTLAEHGKIFNYNGQLIEQSSTLLHTLCLGLAHKLLPLIDMPTLGWGLSLLAGIAVLLTTAGILHLHRINAASLLVLAATPSLLFWSSSGMETAGTTALLTGILLLCLRKENTRLEYSGCVIVTILTVLIRPESFLVLGCFAVLALIFLRLFTKESAEFSSRFFTLLFITTTTFLLVSIWRHYYFGAWFPQPVSAKNHGIAPDNILKGLSYIAWAGGSRVTVLLTATGLLAWLATVFFRQHPHRVSILLAGALALAQIAFIVSAGGDWMDATRFLLPVLPALLLCLVLFLSPWRWLQHTMTVLLFTVALYDSWQFAQTESTGLAIQERNAVINRYLPSLAQQEIFSRTELQSKDALRDIPQLEHLKSLINIIQRDRDSLQIASIQMGFIPYHLDKLFYPRLHFLDLRALSTNDLTQCTVTRNFPRTDSGLKISYEDFFSLLPELTTRCNIQKPDIIYDLGYAMRKDVLARNGYAITFLQQRSIQGDFSRRAIGSELFVAVRQELAEQYGLPDLSGRTVTHADKPAPPNIVLLLADDISYDHFGFMGNAAARTPTLDQLAAQGTVYTTGYVPTAFCRPSLATLLTGQWPHQNRIHANNGVVSLPPGYPTLATRLQQQGYATFAGGKFWEDEPELRGFDSFDTNRNTFARENQNALWQFIDVNAGKKPLFIWWAPMLPHTPHNPPQKFLDSIDAQAIAIPDTLPAEKQEEYRQRTRTLLAMTLWMDDEIRKLHEHLAEKNQLDNTLFVFMSDNGFSHRSPSKSAPSELGLRTPIVFNWSGHIPSRKIDAQTSTIHLYNTLLDYAGVASSVIESDKTVDPGRSLRPVLEERAPAVSEKLFGADYQAVTMKTDPEPRPERDIFALHVRDGEWKYIFYLRDLREEDNADLTIKSGVAAFPTHNAGDEQLYYLPDDAYEEKNLADPAQQQRLDDYRREVLHWWYSTGGKPLDAAANCATQSSILCKKLTAVSN